MLYSSLYKEYDDIINEELLTQLGFYITTSTYIYWDATID